MFEAVEVGRTVAKADFAAREPALRAALLDHQRLAQERQRAVIVIVSGVEGAGKGEVVDRLNEWLDNRGIRTHAFWDPSDEAAERPPFWRFWQALPPRGSIAVMFGSWYTQPIIDYVMHDGGKAQFDRELARINDFEQTLSDDGAIIVKFWFHLSKKRQRKRLERDDASASFKHAPVAARFAKHYDAFRDASERAIRTTDTGVAPWHLIDAANGRYRDLATGDALLRRLTEHLPGTAPPAGGAAPAAAGPAPPATDPAPPAAAPAPPDVHAATVDEQTVLATVDLQSTLAPEAYARRLPAAQDRLHELSWQARDARLSTVIVFEGWDAAGKGSTIRRVTQSIDARLYRVISTAAPTDEERAQHYLWRFWRHIPRRGNITVYDRSWYGRVLVERIERFATPQAWGRAYQEINDFEEQLTDHGVLLLKFWLHISADEQLARFREREQTARKQYKIGLEDWRNRARWGDYLLAVNDMVAHTSTSIAPWTLVPANDKRLARVQVVEHICRELKARLR